MRLVKLLIKRQGAFALSDENEYNVEDVQKVINNVNEFKKVANIYINKNKKSFALVQNITTVSKIRIKKPVNHYDPIKNLIADSLILDLVDNKIKELFINDKQQRYNNEV